MDIEEEEAISRTRSELLQVSEDIYKTNEMIHNNAEMEYYQIKAITLELRRKIDMLQEPPDFVPILDLLDRFVDLIDGKLKYTPEAKAIKQAIAGLKSQYR